MKLYYFKVIFVFDILLYEDIGQLENKINNIQRAEHIFSFKTYKTNEYIWQGWD